MAEIGLTFTNGVADVDLSNGILNYAPSGYDVAYAVYISLFTELDSNPWDDYNPYTLGSNLHLLFKSPVVDIATTINNAVNDAKSALQWLLTGNYVQSIAVTASMPNTQTLYLFVQVVEWTNPTPQNYTYTLTSS